MPPNHAQPVVAEQFGTLEALYPGRIDLAQHGDVSRTVQADLNQDPLHFEDNGYFTFTVKLTELLVALRSCVCAEVEIVFLMFEPEAAMA